LLGAVGSDLAQVLVNQVFENRIAALETIGGDIGQVVGNDVQLGLLGFHAGFGDPE
jgi:hypothetical protein